MAKKKPAGRKKRSTGKTARKSRSTQTGGLMSFARDRLAAVDWLYIRRIASVTGWALTVAGLATAWALGVPKLQAYAGRQIVAPASMQIIFRSPPAWFQGDLRESLIINVLNQTTGDPLDRSQLVNIRDTLLKSGWFSDVRQVTQLRAGVITIDADFFMPFATVSDVGGQHVIDDEGRLLPLTFDAGAKHEFVVIRNQQFQRPNAPGVRWQGEDINAALKLLRFIDGQPWLHQIQAIDLQEFSYSHSLVLISTRGCRIIWGSAPHAEQSLEAFADLKLEYLNHHYTEHGHIDRGHTGEVDLTHREAVVLR
ncbi:MAG: hypothetical protein KC983_11315 [Phycisphaerales bacterium]|nr:hypothetical protein [Phycisphaerales bacterium]